LPMSSMSLCRRVLTVRKTPWWRPAATASGIMCGAGVALALTQATELGRLWRTQLRGRAGACKGATEGLERTGPGGASTLLLFLGDSLVEGVGGQVEGAPSPAALPRNVAARLAEHSGGQVQWASVGITGADVEELQREGLPRLKEKLAAVAPCAQNIVVVLVVGANDLRHFKVVSYRLRLRRLVNELRGLRLGARNDRGVDAVVLPGLRIADAPMLQRYPLQCFLSPVCALWEREKQKAVGFFQEVQVLPFPPLPPGQSMEPMFSADQMHPSISGYEWWGQDLARQIHVLLKERHAKRQSMESIGESWWRLSVSGADVAYLGA